MQQPRDPVALLAHALLLVEALEEVEGIQRGAELLAADELRLHVLQQGDGFRALAQQGERLGEKLLHARQPRRVLVGVDEPLGLPEQPQRLGQVVAFAAQQALLPADVHHQLAQLVVDGHHGSEVEVGVGGLPTPPFGQALGQVDHQEGLAVGIIEARIAQVHLGEQPFHVLVAAFQAVAEQLVVAGVGQPAQIAVAREHGDGLVQVADAELHRLVLDPRDPGLVPGGGLLQGFACNHGPGVKGRWAGAGSAPGFDAPLRAFHLFNNRRGIVRQGHAGPARGEMP